MSTSVEFTTKGRIRHPEASSKPEENVGRIKELVSDSLPEGTLIANIYTLKRQDLLKDPQPAN